MTNLPYELQLGLRYVFGGGLRDGRRNGYVSFMSLISMLGIMVGVAALIIVLSVMNGFQKEVRDRMLSVVSHIEVFTDNGQAFSNQQELMQRIASQPEVLGQAPYVSGQALLAWGERMEGVLLRGIDPAQEPQVSDVNAAGKAVFEQLHPGDFGIVVGDELARKMDLLTGDTVTVIVPAGQVTPLGVTPTLKQMRLVGTFHSGHYQYDAGMAFLHLDDAARILRTGGATGIRIRINDLHQARAVSSQLLNRLPASVWVQDWTQQNRTWFAAVQLEKRMMFIVLSMIVLVAAFNLISTLVMGVTDKRGDIAILRTLGASPRSIMTIFMIQGAIAGVAGTLLGLLLGLLTALNVDVIVPWLEKLFNTQFLPQDVYLISSMPSDPQAADIIPVVLVALLLSFIATLYPSWRASRVHPARALRYE